MLRFHRLELSHDGRMSRCTAHRTLAACGRARSYREVAGPPHLAANYRLRSWPCGQPLKQRKSLAGKVHPPSEEKELATVFSSREIAANSRSTSGRLRPNTFSL